MQDSTFIGLDVHKATISGSYGRNWVVGPALLQNASLTHSAPFPP